MLSGSLLQSLSSLTSSRTVLSLLTHKHAPANTTQRWHIYHGHPTSLDLDKELFKVTMDYIILRSFFLLLTLAQKRFYKMYVVSQKQVSIDETMIQNS